MEKAENKSFFVLNKKDFLSFQIKRKLTDNSKNFLFILEDLRDEGYNFPEEKFLKMRKRILDALNDAVRDINGTIDSLDL